MTTREPSFSLPDMVRGWRERRREGPEVPQARDRVRDWTDGRELGVGPARPTEDPEEEPLPAYVPRSFDEALDRAILAGGLVVLEGESVSGKTRSAYEAIRRAVPDHRLLVPSHAWLLRAVSRKYVLPRGTVVWLDHADHLLAAGSLTERLVDQLCPPGDPGVCVVVTLDSVIRADLPQQMATTVSRIVDDRAERFHVDRDLDGEERERAREHADDQRISRALTPDAVNGFAADITDAPAVLRRWRSAVGGQHARGAAVVSAAVDARRLGYRAPLPRDLLEDLHWHYLEPGRRSTAEEGAFERALAWATDPAGAAAGCLSGVDERSFVPHQHLVSEWARDTTGAEVPTVVWNLLPHRVPAPYLATLGHTARESGRTTAAEHAWTRLLDRLPGHVGSNMGMASLALESGDRTAALPFLRPAASANDPQAMARLGEVLGSITLEGDGSEAEEAGLLLRRAHREGAEVDPLLAGLLAYRERDERRALRWLDAAATGGDEDAMLLHACLETWGRLYSGVDALFDAFSTGRPGHEEILEIVVDATHMTWLSSRFRKSAWARRATIAGYLPALYLMGRTLENEHRWRAALTLYEEAVRRGSRDAARRMPRVHRALGRDGRARVWKDVLSRASEPVEELASLVEWRLRHERDGDAAEALEPLSVEVAVETDTETRPDPDEPPTRPSSSGGSPSGRSSSGGASYSGGTSYSGGSSSSYDDSSSSYDDSSSSSSYDDSSSSSSYGSSSSGSSYDD
ncbi:tetratricopeptide repeat protein [Nocardiopsis sp. NPDC006938]|uniref:tetratricopeptide repeat protein n=1 Tax=Nocardiopsis sp. NPDC006938 TaxID=3364337 RepID=UPI0036B399B5